MEPVKEVEAMLEKLWEHVNHLNDSKRIHPKLQNPRIPNIYIDSADNMVKISDPEFGWEDRIVDERLALLYVAPEMLKKKIGDMSKRSSRQADTWSMGIVMIEASLKNLRPKAILSTHKTEQIERDIKENIRLVREQYGPQLAALLYGLLNTNPELRTELEDIQKIILRNFPTFKIPQMP